jgi:hypothetical protein
MFPALMTVFRVHPLHLGATLRLPVNRLVADGSNQVSGIYYTDSFAPVVKYTTLRIFLAIAAVYSMQVQQLDVESAFIYATLVEVVYVHPHPAMNTSLETNASDCSSLSMDCVNLHGTRIHTCMSSSHLLDSVAAHWTTVLARALLMEL